MCVCVICFVYLFLVLSCFVLFCLFVLFIYLLVVDGNKNYVTKPEKERNKTSMKEKEQRTMDITIDSACRVESIDGWMDRWID